MRRFLLLMLLALLVLTACSGSPGEVSDPDVPDAQADEPLASAPITDGVAEVADQVLPAVARVDVNGAAGQGSGSAVVFREDGYLVTNNHVVKGAADVSVTLADGTVEEAEVVGTAPFADLAVLRIDATDLPVPEYDEAAPEVGGLAVAVGSPFGLDATVTAGVISALNRSLAQPDGGALGDLLQTDAAINPGSSGGALADGQGEIIGINTAILSRTGQNGGIGFAIPSATVVPIAERLIEDGEVQPAYLGIRGEDVRPRVAELYGLDVSEGVIVAAIEPGSPADEAGLQRGDVIVEFDGDPVGSIIDLTARVRTTPAEQEVPLTVNRDGEEMTLAVSLTTTQQ